MSMVNAQGVPLEKLRQLAAGDEAADQYAIELLHTLQTGDEEMRGWASDALQAVESPPLELASAIAQMCQHTSAPVAAGACRLLAKLGGKATQYQSAIVGCLQSHAEVTARQQAALALGGVPDLTPETLDALRQSAQGANLRLRRLAEAALHKASG